MHSHMRGTGTHPLTQALLADICARAAFGVRKGIVNGEDAPEDSSA